MSKDIVFTLLPPKTFYNFYLYMSDASNNLFYNIPMQIIYTQILLISNKSIQCLNTRKDFGTKDLLNTPRNCVIWKKFFVKIIQILLLCT